MPGLRKTQLAARDRVANGTPMPMKRGRMTDKENVDPQGIQTPKGTREVTGLCVEAGNSVKAGACSVTNSIISAGFIQTPSPRERQGLAPTPETSSQLEIACRTCNSILFAQNGPGCGVLLSSSHSFNVCKLCFPSPRYAIRTEARTDGQYFPGDFEQHCVEICRLAYPVRKQ